jgi:hypothetical protein
VRRAFALLVAAGVALAATSQPAHALSTHPGATPGLKQLYIASPLQWSFDARDLIHRARRY